MEKMIKLSAVFKVVDGEDKMFVETVINYDAEKASKNSRLTKLELYEGLKQLTVHQIKMVSKKALVLDATADEVKGYFEQE